MTSSQHGAYVQGYTHATMGRTMGLPPRERERIPKPFLSWDWRLKFASMNAELVVIADQHAAVNTFQGLVHTARQANKVGSTRKPCLSGTKVRSAMGTKS